MSNFNVGRHESSGVGATSPPDTELRRGTFQYVPFTESEMAGLWIPTAEKEAILDECDRSTVQAYENMLVLSRRRHHLHTHVLPWMSAAVMSFDEARSLGLLPPANQQNAEDKTPPLR